MINLWTRLVEIVGILRVEHLVLVPVSICWSPQAWRASLRSILASGRRLNVRRLLADLKIE